jgi:hypothetical protein
VDAREAERQEGFRPEIDAAENEAGTTRRNDAATQTSPAATSVTNNGITCISRPNRTAPVPTARRIENQTEPGSDRPACGLAADKRRAPGSTSGRRRSVMGAIAQKTIRQSRAAVSTPAKTGPRRDGIVQADERKANITA